MTTTVNLAKCTLITSNETYDFYIVPVCAGNGKTRRHYCYAVLKGTNQRHTMAGFITKRDAVECANVWAGWMK